MHMADLLITPTVAGTMGGVSASLLAVAVRQTRKSGQEGIVPLMGVTGAFVLAAQMLNFTIPGTGSSGHLIGGILLAALLGPWTGFLVLTSVLLVQCLLFADGGLMALGCNIFNMAACSCLLAYPLLFRPIAGKMLSATRLTIASLLACVIGLEVGALMVTLETSVSGVASLPFLPFLRFMLLIHLPIGIGEGLATAGVLLFVRRMRPEMLTEGIVSQQNSASSSRMLWLGVAFSVLVVTVAWLWASALPDGLEWSILKAKGG